MALDRSLVAAALPGYEVGDEIGRGGWGAVYQGRHVALGRDVAIKHLPHTLAADEQALSRFIDEARIIGQLDHPHLVKVYDFVSHEGMWLIVMEYLGGGTIWDQFNDGGFRSDEACAVALALCAGLAVAHGDGILHRDIKPENIMISSDGTVRLCDFGIAKVVASPTRHTHVGEVVGTPTYMSPEQALGDDLNVGSDIYSLGVLLYELLSGRLPYSEAKSPTQQLVQHISEVPVPLLEAAPDLPDAIARAVMTALEKHPDARYASAEAFGIAIAHAAGESFGTDWLESSGVVVMGGGSIQAAALKGPTSGRPPAGQPTLAHPAVRDDHFRPAVQLEAHATIASVGVAGEVETFSAAQPAAPTTPSPRILEPHEAEELPIPPPPPSAETPAQPVQTPSAPEPQSTKPGRRGVAVIAGVLVVLALLIIVVGLTLVAGSGDEPEPTVASPVRDCPAGELCAFIDSGSIRNDQLTIEWTPDGFTPAIAAGRFHVHFFWDVYLPEQAGTNAALFGVSIGEWEEAESDPFMSRDEMLASNRPEGASRVCVTVTNAEHEVVNPSVFECVRILEGV